MVARSVTCVQPGPLHICRFDYDLRQDLSQRQEVCVSDEISEHESLPSVERISPR